MNSAKRITIALIVIVLCSIGSAPLRAESAAGLSWSAPSSWKSQPKRMRVANYVVPAQGGDSEDGECAVYYFGPGQGGGVDANVKRWIGQFQAPGGGPADKLAKTEKKAINGINVTTVEVTGTYLFKPAPMAPQVTPKPGYRMLAAIAEGSDAPVFFKLTAPKKTADASEADFRGMLESLKKQ